MIVKWSFLRDFGNSKIVKSNYFWIFAIPFLAKNLDPLSLLLGVNIEITFSLERLFFASLCFAIGTFLYQLSCPQLIKDHKSYSDFFSDGKSGQHIADYYRATNFPFLTPTNYYDIRNSIKEYDLDGDNCNKIVIGILNEKSTCESLFIDTKLIPNFFWKVYKEKENHYQFIAYITLGFYIGGVVFLLWTGLSNILFAFNLFIQ
ncbi:MAG: hypothetical protein ACI9OE_002587 [Mariniflexile sp.]|jgi:hypothetical protein